VTRRRAALAALLVALVAWGFTDVRRRAAWDPAHPSGHRTDVTVYTTASRAMLAGGDPYAAPSPRGWHYLYPPLFALLLAPLDGLDPEWQGVVWYFVSLLLAFASLREVARLLRAVAPGAPRAFRVLAVVALAFPALNTLQRGQAGFAVLYPLLLGLRVVLTGRSRAARFGGGVALALPVVIKLTPAMPVGVLLLAEAVRSRARSAWLLLGGAAGLLVFVLLLPAAAIGWRRNADLLAEWTREVAANPSVEKGRFFVPWTVRNQSFENGVRRLEHLVSYAFLGGKDDRRLDLGAEFHADPPEDSRAAGWVVAAVRVLLVVLLLAAAVRLARAPPVERAALFGAACAASLAVSPLAWGHHFVLWYPAALLVPVALDARGPAWRRRAAWFSGCAAALPVLHYAALPVAGRLGLLGIGVTIWTALALVALLKASRPPNV